MEILEPEKYELDHAMEQVKVFANKFNGRKLSEVDKVLCETAFKFGYHMAQLRREGKTDGETKDGQCESPNCDGC